MKNNERTIVVTGVGSVKRSPDTVVLRFDISVHKMDYDQTLKLLNLKVKGFRDMFEQMGFKREDLKTKDYSIDQSRHYDDKKKEYIFNGYKGEHRLEVKFPIDKKRISQVLKALANSTTYPNYSMQFTIEDQEGLKLELLEKSVKNAKKKAEVLASAAGVSFGDILSINYSWKDVYLTSRNYNVSLYSQESADNFSAEIEPDDIEKTDNVTVVWEIRNS